MSLRAQIEVVFARQVSELTGCPEFQALEAGEASREDYDRFIESGARAHLLSPQLEAFLYALAPPAADVWQFRLIPDVDRCRYDLLVEPRGEPSEPAGLAFLDAFDQAFARLNVEYASKRASRRLGPPRLAVMRPGWAERQCRADFEAGKRELQYKWPAIRLEWDAASRDEVARRHEAQP